MPAGPAARLTGALAGVLLGDFSLDAAGAAAGNLDAVLVFSIVVFTSSPDSGLERDAASKPLVESPLFPFVGPV